MRKQDFIGVANPCHICHSKTDLYFFSRCPDCQIQCIGCGMKSMSYARMDAAISDWNSINPVHTELEMAVIDLARYIYGDASTVFQELFKRIDSAVALVPNLPNYLKPAEPEPTWEEITIQIRTGNNGERLEPGILKFDGKMYKEINQGESND